MRMTPAAVAHIRFLIAQHGAPVVTLRLSMAPGGCAGTALVFALAVPQPDDVVISQDDVTAAIAPTVAVVVRGATLDYGAWLRPPRFRILRAPHLPWRCPCGRSFGLPYPGKPTPHCQAYVPMPWDADD